MTGKTLEQWGENLSLELDQRKHVQVRGKRLQWLRSKLTGDHWLKQREITSLEAYLVSIQAKDFCPSFTNEILLKIRSMIDEINITSKDFKFTTAFRVDMALTASGHALGKFCKVFP